MRIGLFYINSGGGHRSAAISLAETLKARGVEPVLIDILCGSNFFWRWFFMKGYGLAVSFWQGPWKVVYVLNKIRWIMWVEKQVFDFLFFEKIKKIFEKEKIDKAISFYFFLNSPVKKISQQNNIPFYCVITDIFTAHPLWFFDPEIDFFVFSDKIANYAQSWKVKKERLKVVAPFVRNEFLRIARSQIDTNFLIKEMDLDQSIPLVLVLAGGFGLPKGKKILRELFKFENQLQIAVVSGQDEKFFNFAEKIKKTMGGEQSVRIVKVWKFTDQVALIMSLSQIVITKGGPGVCVEAAILGKPMVVNSYIWGQENGNIEFIKESGLGEYIPKIRDLNLSVERALVKSKSIGRKTFVPLVNGAEEVAGLLVENKSLLGYEGKD